MFSKFGENACGSFVEPCYFQVRVYGNGVAYFHNTTAERIELVENKWCRERSHRNFPRVDALKYHLRLSHSLTIVSAT